MIYVTSPYIAHTSDEELKKEIEQARYEAVARHVSLLAEEGLVCYSPINHWHPVATCYDLTGDSDYWKKQNREMLIRAGKMQIYALPGYQESKGLEFEREVAYKNDIPEKRIEPPYEVTRKHHNLIKKARKS